MYSRAYGENEYSKPKNYNGTAFSPPQNEENKCDTCEFKKNACLVPKKECECDVPKKESGKLKFDTDDILLLAIGFLLLNGEGDDETLMLLAALFILGVI